MDLGLQMFGSTLRDNGVQVHLLKKYVDDVLLVSSLLRLGSRWNNGRIEHSEEWEKEDADAGLSQEKVTLQVFIDVANSQIKFLKFTGEVSEGSDNKIPVLDSEVWWGTPEEEKVWFSDSDSKTELTPGAGIVSPVRSTVMYSFYAKPMVNQLTILKRSAMPERTKVSTISAEILRRWKCTSVHRSAKAYEEITMKYMDALAAMGYSEIVKSGEEGC